MAPGDGILGGRDPDFLRRDAMSDQPSSSAKPNVVQFHICESKSYRHVSADGALGSMTPQGKLYIAFFTDHGAIPEFVRHEVLPNGQMGAEVSRQGRDGIDRQVEVAVTLDTPAAKSFHLWLGDRLKEIDSLTAAQSPKGA